MINWLKKKESNYQPEDCTVTKTETSKTEESEKPAHTYYRLGLTDNNRVSLLMGYSEVTFNRAGVNNFIKQLELFRDQLEEVEQETEE